MFVNKIQNPKFCVRCAIISVHIGIDVNIFPQGVGKGYKSNIL